jgi:glycosyltransferase involved in cell wall biosynthesis
MKSLKVLQLNNIAEIAPKLSEQQSLVGINSTFINLWKPFGSSGGALKLLSIPIRLIHALFLRLKIHLGDYDIVHIHYATSALFFLGIKAKLIVHVHGSDVRDQHFNVLRFKINQLIFNHADLIFYSTPDLKAHLDNYHVDAHFIPNPVDIANFFESCPPRHRNIFIHASISRIKGAPIIIEALNKVKDLHPHLKISFLGFGDMLDKITHLNFHRLPRFSPEKLKDLISESGLILGQFKVGAIGMSELEALACKRPVICHFEYDHFYAEAPPLLKARTADEIVAFINQYANDPESFLKDKDYFREWVIKYHSKEKIERLIFQYYLSLF